MAVAAPPARRSTSPPALAAVRRLAGSLALPIGSVVLAFVVGGLIVKATRGDPIAAYRALICGGFGLFCRREEIPALQISNTIIFTTPLILTGVSVALAFRGGLFNIGAEGQFLVGAMACTVLGVTFARWPGFILLPIVLVGGTLAGAVWGGIVGVLKAVTGAHEVVTTIMLNYVAQWLLRYLIVGGPLQAPNGYSASSPIGKGAQLPHLLPQDRVVFGLPGSVYGAHTGIFIALAGAVAFAFLLWRSTLGYEIRAVGQSQRAARYAGISVRRTMVVTMLISGAFSGLAGAVQISGVPHDLTDIYFVDSTGFDAIAVALLGLTSAVGIVLAAILFGALHAGGAVMQSDANISGSLVLVLQALILFSIAANFLGAIKIRLPAPGRSPGTPEADAAAAAAAAEVDTALATDLESSA